MEFLEQMLGVMKDLKIKNGLERETKILEYIKKHNKSVPENAFPI
jgi:hypothetical protein